MKSKTFSILCFAFVLICSNAGSNEVPAKNKISAPGITIYSSAELYPMAEGWANAYMAITPGLRIHIVSLTDKEIAHAANGNGNICLVSSEFPGAEKGPAFRLDVGREIIVPVINSKNPYSREIGQQGISAEALAASIVKPGKMNWGTLLHNAGQSPLKFYILNDGLTVSKVGDFIHSDLPLGSAVRCRNAADLVAAVQSDSLAIGFCSLSDIIILGGSSFYENISLMPIDKNGNGRMDYMEKIYDNFRDFTRGVWIGKYPSNLTGQFCFACSSKPADESETAFLQWVLTTGQDLLPAKGYCSLLSNERFAQMDKLSGPGIIQPAREPFSTAKIILMALLVFMALGLTLEVAVLRKKNKKAGVGNHQPFSEAVFDESRMEIPAGLYYDKTHTWAFLEPDGLVKTGIDDFLQHVTGPISSVGMKTPGARINKGDQLCILIRKGKHLVVYAPVSGIVKEFNPMLSSDPTLINTSPCSDGWIYRMEPTNWLREVAFLSMAHKYRTWLGTEFTRLKDFLALIVQKDAPRPAYLVLQDGGALKDSVLANLGPDVWEEFQARFLDTSK